MGMGEENAANGGDRDPPAVCVVTHPLGPAGENATRTLLSILAAITTVSLLTADLPADSVMRDRHEVVELTERGAGQSNPLLAAARFVANQLRMCAAITRREEAIVLFFGATAYLLPIVWARLLGRTVVLEPRGDVPRTLRLSWERRVPAVLARALAGTVWALERLDYRLADAIVTYTPAMASELGLDAFGDKLYPTGARYVDTDRFAPHTPFEERDRTVGFLGRIDEEKGIRTLAAVAASLPADVTFRFVGDGDLLPWLREELADEVASGRVELAVWVDHEEVPAELNRLRLLVMPSAPTEGLPTTILEALACGTPVYATPVSGVPDVVKDGETGFLMEGSDPDDVRAGVVNALDRGDLAAVSANGRRLIETEYSFEAATARYGAILRGLAAGESEASGGRIG
jgi:glycosyltransferase involved in cell wall biosynthesis